MEKRTVKHRRAPGRGDYEAKPQTVPQEGPISHGDPAIRFLGSCDDSFQARCEWPLPAPSALPLARACKLGLFSQFEWIPPLGCDSGGWSQSKTRDSNLVRWSCGERLQLLHCRQIAAAVKPHAALRSNLPAISNFSERLAMRLLLLGSCFRLPRRFPARKGEWKESAKQF